MTCRDFYGEIHSVSLVKFAFLPIVSCLSRHAACGSLEVGMVTESV